MSRWAILSWHSLSGSDERWMLVDTFGNESHTVATEQEAQDLKTEWDELDEVEMAHCKKMVPDD